MEEIEGRFELIRIAVHLGDYEVIDTQIRRLRNMSTDKLMHGILYELEGKNFRQALYMMKDYAETLRDDFFNPPISETATPATSPTPTQHRFTDPVATPTRTSTSTPAHSHATSTSPQTQHPEAVTAAEPSPMTHPTTPEPVNQPEPGKPEPDLFNLANPTSSEAGEEHSMTLDEMLAMTKESATDPRRYQAPEPVEKSEPEPVAKSEPEIKPEPEPEPELELEPKPEPEASTIVPSSEAQVAEFVMPEPTPSSGEPDPLFTLDQDIASAPTPKPKPEPKTTVPRSSKPADPTPLPETQQEEVVPSSPMDMTPLFGGGNDLELGDDLLTFPPVSGEDEASTEVSDTVEEPVEATAMGLDTGIFALEEPGFFEMETPVVQEAEPEPEVVSVSAPMTEPTPPIVEATVTSVVSAEEPSPIQEPAAVPEPTESLEPTPVIEEAVAESTSEPDAVSPEIVEEDPRPRRWEFEPDEDDVLYEKFSYMGQKFRIMMHRYPLKEEVEEGVIDEVRDFIHMVSVRDYSESQVEAAIARYQELKEQGRIVDAAQMLIAAATTESKFAQFMLARELFKGEVLQQDFPESFTQINRLAEEDYPEAICDLGQLYEYGIGINKNKQHALLLYEEAAQIGVERAQRHYDRLRGSNPLQSIKSLTSALLRKKK